MFGKFSILNSLDELADKINPAESSNTACLVVVGASDVKADNIFIIDSPTVLNMRAVFKATADYKQVYIYGAQSYMFLLFAIMFPIYCAKNPGSRYIIEPVLEKLVPKLAGNINLVMSRLIQMELQLKILFS